MPIQTTYGVTTAPGFAGMVADMRNRTIVSREVGNTSVALPFGAVALRGLTDHAVVAVGTASAGGFLGIAVMDPTERPVATTNTVAYQVGDTAAIMLKGGVWVTVTSAVTPGAPAYFDSSGNITATSTSNTAITGATFETTAASGGVAVLKL